MLDEERDQLEAEIKRLKARVQELEIALEYAYYLARQN